MRNLIFLPSLKLLKMMKSSKCTAHNVFFLFYLNGYTSHKMLFLVKAIDVWYLWMYWVINVCKIQLKLSYMNVFACLCQTTLCVVILLCFVGVTRVLHEIKICTDIY